MRSTVLLLPGLGALGLVAASMIGIIGSAAHASPCDGGGPIDVTCFDAGPDDSYGDEAAFKAALAAGTDVYVPPGRYILGMNQVFLPPGTTLHGVRDASILMERFVTADASVPCDDAAFAMLNVYQTGDAAIANVTVKDLTLEGPVIDDFCEPHALLSVSGVDHFKVDGVTFTGFRGDGLSIGTYDPDTGHHNTNVVVQNSTFDGVDHRNRQGISILDGQNVAIENNLFTRTTRPYMPGAIDIEPDLPDALLANIAIRNNTFTEIGSLDDRNAVSGNCIVAAVRPQVALSGIPSRTTTSPVARPSLSTLPTPTRAPWPSRTTGSLPRLTRAWPSPSVRDPDSSRRQARAATATTNTTACSKAGSVRPAAALPAAPRPRSLRRSSPKPLRHPLGRELASNTATSMAMVEATS